MLNAPHIFALLLREKLMNDAQSLQPRFPRVLIINSHTAIEY